MRERQDLEHVPVHDLVDNLLGRHRLKGVVDGLRPRAHLLVLGAGQIAELLAADSVKRPEHDHLAVLAALEDGFEAGGQGQCALPGAGPPTERHDPDAGIEQQVERDALLGTAPVQAERLPVAAHESHLLALGDPAQRRSRVPMEDQAGVAGQVPRLVEVEEFKPVQVIDPTGVDVDLFDPAPLAGRRQLGSVLLSDKSHRRGLDPQWEVLGDDHDVVALSRQIACHGEDPGVVVADLETAGQDRRIGVIEFHPQGSAAFEGNRFVEAAGLHTQVVEQSQRSTREVAELGVRALALQFRDHNRRDHHFMFVEPQYRVWVREQDAGVDDVGTEWVVKGHARPPFPPNPAQVRYAPTLGAVIAAAGNATPTTRNVYLNGWNRCRRPGSWLPIAYRTGWRD